MYFLPLFLLSLNILMETASVSEGSGPNDMEVIEEKNIISAYWYSYKIEHALKYNKKSCISFVQFTNTMCCWIRVTGSHDMEDIEKTAIILY